MGRLNPKSVTSFVRKWKACKACPLHHWAHRHVLYRGQIPAKVLFIGEAPGPTEDKVGEPFIGKAGEVLNKMLSDLSLTDFCIANTVCCIPWKDNKKGTTFRPPSDAEKEACSPHLDELICLCGAKLELIVLLGREAEKSYSVSLDPKQRYIPTLAIRHPSFILRNGGVTSLEYKRNLHALSKALSDAGILHQVPPVTKVC